MKKIICFVFALLILLFSVFPQRASAQEISTNAESFALIDGDSAEIIAAKNENKKMPMASTTKIMTAVCIIENCDLDMIAEIPEEACGIEGSSMYLFKGERISVRDLLFGLMLESANDAAVALALICKNTVENFALLMNETAKRIGLNNTHYMNPNGLGQKDHYSSAFDLALLLRYAMQNKEFAEICGTKRIYLSVNGEKKQVAVNHNRLLSDYEYCIGGKTGYTKEAGRCLVTVAEKDGKKLYCATLSDHDDWNDHKKLFDHGFSLFHRELLFDIGQLSREVAVVGGTEEKVRLINLDAVSSSVRGEDEITVEWCVPRFLYAKVSGLDLGNDPESVGELLPIGECGIYQRGYLIAKCNVYAEKSIERSENKSIIKSIRDFFISLWESIWN